MKTALAVLLALVLSAIFLHAFAPARGSHFGQAAAAAGDGPTTTSIRPSRSVVQCGQPFHDSFYALTREVFADGAENVVLADYEAKTFALIRSADEFEGYAEAFVDHAKDIPRQLLEIIREDSSVLNSCESFSVALVGPP